MKSEIEKVGTGEIVLYQPDEMTKLEVRLEDETVWLTQQQIADLFGTKRPAITKHLNNIFKSGELSEVSVSSILEHTATDGKTYQTKFYNLDAILSVGYRVNSINATMFRRWATIVLKQHLIQGYTINRQLVALQSQVDERFVRIEDTLERHEEQINFFIRTNLPPHEGVVFEGQLLEGRKLAEELIKSAVREVVLIDGYVDAKTFHILECRAENVKATIYTDSVGPRIETLQKDYENEYGADRHIEVHKFRNNFHDRFLIIDDDVYHFGASLKDLGKRLFAFDKMGLSKELILSQV